MSDFKDLIEVFKVVFGNEEATPESEYLATLLANPCFIVFVVKIKDKVVGGLTIYVLHRYYNTRPSAYIYDLGILPYYQRQGLGKALITEVCMFCAQNNFEEAYVEAESDDIDAVSFYRKTKSTSEINATHFNYSFHK